MAPKQLWVARFKQFSFKPVLKCQQEAQLSQKGRAMPRVVEYFG